MLYSCSLEETVITKGHVTTANTRAHARTHTVLGLMRTSSRLVTVTRPIQSVNELPESLHSRPIVVKLACAVKLKIVSQLKLFMPGINGAPSSPETFLPLSAVLLTLLHFASNFHLQEWNHCFGVQLPFLPFIDRFLSF